MMGLLFIVVAGASLLSLQVAAVVGNGDGSVEKPGTAVTTKHAAKRLDCLPAMNEARAKVDYPKFAAPGAGGLKLPIVDSATTDSGPAGPQAGNREDLSLSGGAQSTENKDHANFLNDFCTRLKAGNQPVKDQNDNEKTYMFAPANSTNVEECSEAVDYWKSAVTSFTTLPPQYTEGQAPYDKHKNISFVGLFNAANNTTVDCAAITCNPESEEEGAVSSREAENTAVFSLLCLSSPPALKASEPPFTQAQWDKITGVEVENSTTQPNWLGALAIAAAALGHAIL